jgi:DNA processing protein
VKDIEKRYRLRYALTKTTSFKTFFEIIEKYGSIENLYSCGDDKLVSDTFNKPRQNDIENEIENNDYMVYGEEIYPVLLSHIPSPPIALFYKGDLSILQNTNIISIVGTRNNTDYGSKVTTALVEKLAKNKYTFVSGMALGIDTIVHKTAIESNSSTIAVLPSSLGVPTPNSNKYLFQKICEKGLALSEYPSVQVWNKYLYHRRNRIIAGLTPTTIVVEAPKKSGALITANYAFDFDREVYAVPGSIHLESSKGCNDLIKRNMAQILTDISDLLPLQNEFHFNNRPDGQQLSPEDIAILNVLQTEPMSFDQILNCVSMSDLNLKEHLFEMELEGHVCLNGEGKYYININNK